MDDISRNLPEGKQSIILVDALDEADMLSDPGANLLYLPSRLPKGIYFILATRPLRDLPLFVDCARKNFSLDLESHENLTDIRCYIELVVDRGSLFARLQSTQQKVNESVETLLRKSEGNFMYLHYVLPELERAEIKTDELPQGPMSYYERHWQKMKSRNQGRWLKFQQPVLCVLGSIREPITVRELAQFVPGLNHAEIAVAMGDWRPFLKEIKKEGETLHRSYHKSS